MTLSLLILLWACGAVAHMAVFTKMFNQMTLSDAFWISLASWVGVLVGGVIVLGKAFEGLNPVVWRRKE